MVKSGIGAMPETDPPRPMALNIDRLGARFNFADLR